MLIHNSKKMSKKLDFKKAMPKSEDPEEPALGGGDVPEEEAGFMGDDAMPEQPGADEPSDEEPEDEEPSEEDSDDEEEPPAPPVSEEVSDTIGDLIEDRRYKLRTKAIATRLFLAKQPLVQTMIPRFENEQKDATQSYNINGFGFYIRKGVFQMVPQEVAKMISETYNQDANIVADHALNLKNNTAAAKEFSR